MPLNTTVAALLLASITPDVLLIPPLIDRENPPTKTVPVVKVKLPVMVVFEPSVIPPLPAMVMFLGLLANKLDGTEYDVVF